MSQRHRVNSISMVFVGSVYNSYIYTYNVPNKCQCTRCQIHHCSKAIFFLYFLIGQNLLHKFFNGFNGTKYLLISHLLKPEKSLRHFCLSLSLSLHLCVSLSYSCSQNIIIRLQFNNQCIFMVVRVRNAFNIALEEYVRINYIETKTVCIARLHIAAKHLK